MVHGIRAKRQEDGKRGAVRTNAVVAVAAGLLVSLALTGQVRAEKESFTPDHVAKLRAVGSASISPDGKQIAYVLSVPRTPFKDDNGPAWAELHVVDQTGKSRPFVTGKVNVGSVHWTPDGRGISFLAKRDDDKHKSLYVIPIDGGEARRVLTAESGITSYSWSPDGRRVAYIATEKEPKARKDQKDKGFGQIVFEEDWRPKYVWIATPDDETDKPRKLDLPGTPSELHWSPVGTRLAVALAPSPMIDDHYMKRRVYVVNADSGEVIAKLDNIGKLGSVAWSPDGKRLAILSGEDINDPSPGRLMVADVASVRPRIPLRNILPDFEGEVKSIAWKDADTVMYLASQGVWTAMGEVRHDGSGRKIHIPAGKFVLSHLTLSENGQSAAAINQSPTHPGEVVTMSHSDQLPRRLTDSNPWFKDMRFAPQEVVTYQARDGLSIEGLLIHPLDEQPGQRYPLILTVHGGPESHYPNGWLTAYSRPGQVAAAEGFAVFYPNYRGSTGRGVPFSKMSQADLGGKEFDDLVDGVDHLINMGLVDRDRVGVTGGSYGGFASAWCATYYTDRFAASVMFVGISNQISKWGTSDIPEELFLVHARKRVYEHWDHFMKRSPIYYAHKSKTPILILHGKDDPRVFPGQSLELHRLLKTLHQTPVRLVLYPGEGHGNRKAAARYDYNLRMMRWFNYYLKGDGGDPPNRDIEYPLESANKKNEEE